jgi:hypothetical protein
MSSACIFAGSHWLAGCHEFIQQCKHNAASRYSNDPESAMSVEGAKDNKIVFMGQVSATV